MNSLLVTIQALEVELHHPGVRCDVQRLEQLLHKDFHEVGRSGREYDRVTVVRFLSEQKASTQVISENFNLQQLERGVSLLTYRSAHLKLNGTLENHTLRSSVWVQVGAQWQLIYHQGTPAAQPW
ncbi:nuclear transport factor 2 family protein [Derxia lacustris]|uniref:nuclear transport factor 2 family protein n=1 Tax=Derxia lacustris TaxID=764842 RepID=UPI001592F686|nr:nuclear transport factor 2 family protein [Derxia lacustris]